MISSRLLMHNLTLIMSTVLAGALSAQSPPPITGCAISPNGKNILTSSQDGITRYGLATERQLKTYSISSANLHDLAFSPDGSHLLIVGGRPSEEWHAAAYHWPSFKLHKAFNGAGDSITTNVWLSDDKFATADLEGLVKVWFLSSNKPHLTLNGHSNGITSLVYLKSQDLLVSGGLDNSIRVWDAGQGTLIRSLNQHTHPVTAIAIAPVESALPIIASAGEDRTVRFWQPTIGRMVRYIRLPTKPLCLAWLTDRHLVAAGRDGILYVVDSLNVEITNSVRASKSWIYSLAYDERTGYVIYTDANGRLGKQKLPISELAE
ncbi:MAG: hypothetical protein CMM03_00815 [Rhodopirellula sp.]|nr:hypothetical protein [Rhodopirellula sp.]